MRAMDCAVILLNHADALEIKITNLQLQKYLYFINARFFRDNQYPLIDDHFETWKYGPVVPDLYNHFSFYGANSIDVDFERTRLDQFNQEVSNEEVKYLDNHMDQFLRKLKSKNIFDLVDITHKEPIWLNHREEILRGQHFIYTDDDLANVDKKVL